MNVSRMTKVTVVFDMAVETHLLACSLVDFRMLGQKPRVVGHFHPMAFLADTSVFVAGIALFEAGLLCLLPVTVRPISGMRHLKVTSRAIRLLVAEPATR